MSLAIVSITFEDIPEESPGHTDRCAITCRGDVRAFSFSAVRYTTWTTPARWRGYPIARARDRRQSIVLAGVTGGRAGSGARQLLSSIVITVPASTPATTTAALSEARGREGQGEGLRAKGPTAPEILRYRSYAAREGGLAPRDRAGLSRRERARILGLPDS